MLRHPYHLVDESPWPILSALSTFLVTTGMVFWFQSNDTMIMTVGTITLLTISMQWWRDVSAEGSLQGSHSGIVELGLRWGMILFIISEIFFFLSFFWSYFHMSLAPSIEIGSMWAPEGIITLSPMEMPLLNTMILIISGISVTWSHHSMMESNHSEALLGLLTTVVLGILFTALQIFEYLETSFSMADSVYGSVFFIATGFHGFHVLVGTLFLLVSAKRLSSGYLSPTHHFGFEASAWYWHFVDVVWLFLYMIIYWWGSM